MKGEDFRRWAERGCRIYGDDPMFFLRELAQNARDAGARCVDIRARVEDDSTAILSFEDDGAGMTAQHARRFLFRLYASSKEGDSRSAGYYGIGFWSVLRFKPAAVFIESRSGKGTAWGVRLDASLEVGSVQPSLEHVGTRITLVRPLAAGEDAESFVRAVEAGASRYCRHLRRNDRRATPLPVRCNGRLISVPIEPEGPVGLAFRRGPVEGAVGLGESASVELLARGLPVWRGTLLDELAYGGTGLAWRSEVARGLAPVFVLNGNDLAVVMARNAVIDDGALGRVRDEARDALARLVEMHVGAVAGGGPLWRIAAFLRRLPGKLMRPRMLVVIPSFLLGVGAVLLLTAMGLHNAGVVDVWTRATEAGLAIDAPVSVPLSEGTQAEAAGPPGSPGDDGAGGMGGPSGRIRQGVGGRPESPAGASGAGTEVRATGVLTASTGSRGAAAGAGGASTDAGSAGAEPPSIRPLPTVPSVYRGATVDAPAQRAVLLLSYSPPIPLWFKFLTADHFLLDRGFVGDDATGDAPYPAHPCSVGCVEVSLELEGPGSVVLPCPTGRSVDGASVRVNSAAAGDLVRADRHGQAWLVLPDGLARVTYRVGTSGRTELSAKEIESLVSLPDGIHLPLDALEPLRRASSGGVRAQVDALARVAGRLMEYDDSAEAAAQYVGLPPGGHWLRFVLSLGRGDCDVINAVAAVLLRRVGIPARLAVGAVGLDGRVQPGSHAWVEYFDEGWQAVDVSRGEVVRGNPASELESWPLAGADVPRGRGRPVERRGAAGSGSAGMGATAGAGSAGGGATAGTESAESQWGAPAARTVPRESAESAGGSGSLAGVRWELGRPGTVLPLASALALAALGCLLGLRHRRRERFRFEAVREEGTRILADMLRSAQAQPSAWRHAPSLWHARVLPLLGGGTLSLSRASSLAGRGALYSGRAGVRLAELVASKRLAVLDVDAPHYGGVIRSIPGGIDLERLESLAARAPEFEDRLMARSEAVLAEVGVRRPLLWCDGLGGTGAAAFRVGAAGRLGGFPLPTGFIGLSPDADFVREARRISRGNEALAVLHLVEAVLERVEGITPTPRRLLAAVARRLLTEGGS